MTTYQLSLTINPSDLQVIYQAQENLIIAKAADNPDNSPNTAWLSFAPLENNSVAWTEEYAIGAQHSDGQVSVSTTTPYPAQLGVCYPMTANGFAPPGSCLVPVSPNSYGCINQVYSPIFTFGLLQASTVNGQSNQPAAVTQEIVPPNQQGIFTPTLTVWIWLASGLAAGAPVNFTERRRLLGQAVSRPAVVTLNPDSPSASLQYESGRGMFVPAG
jgi:hypothetical protein